MSASSTVVSGVLGALGVSVFQECGSTAVIQSVIFASLLRPRDKDNTRSRFHSEVSLLRFEMEVRGSDEGGLAEGTEGRIWVWTIHRSDKLRFMQLAS